MDLLVVIVIAIAWDRFYQDTGIGGVIFAVMAVLLPLLIAAWLTRTSTAPEAAAVLSLLVGIANGFILIGLAF